MNRKYVEFRIQYKLDSPTWFDDETKYADYTTAVHELDRSRAQSKAEGIDITYRLVQRSVEELVFNI